MSAINSKPSHLSTFTKVASFKGTCFEVTLTSRTDRPYHCFEVSSGSLFYREGGLEIETINGVHYVSGYDGVGILPMAVAIVLADLGYGFAPFVFPTDLIPAL